MQSAVKEFKVGSIVTLKSGGPLMTIITFNQIYDTVSCVWFDEENVLHRTGETDDVFAQLPIHILHLNSSPEGEPSLKDGDTVRLRSGGQGMTIRTRHPNATDALCIWITDDSKFHQQIFPILALRAS